jgi:proteasome lid subunit RPN8/RPN11
MTDMVDISNPAHPAHSNYLISTNGIRAEPVHFHEEPLFESTIEELLSHLDGRLSERCGFITSDDQEVVVIENIHEDSRNNFYMCEEKAIKAIDYIYEKTDRTILGIWHTHPNGYAWPSPRDIAGWPKKELQWRYFLVSRGVVTEWTLVHE